MATFGDSPVNTLLIDLALIGNIGNETVQYMVPAGRRAKVYVQYVQIAGNGFGPVTFNAGEAAIARGNNSSYENSIFGGLSTIDPYPIEPVLPLQYEITLHSGQTFGLVYTGGGIGVVGRAVAVVEEYAA